MREAFVFPEVAPESSQRPRACPRCGQVAMGRHRKKSRRLVDLKVNQIALVQSLGGFAAGMAARGA